MIIYTDNEGRIKDVNTTNDTSLIQVEVTDDTFEGWSVAKICCYKVYTSQVRVTPYPEPIIEVDEKTGEKVEIIPDDVPEEEIEYKTIITGYTPYVDSRLLEHIDQLGKATEAITPYKETKTGYIEDTEMVFYDVPADGNVTVFFNHPYTIKRVSDKITLTFEPLDDITDITISIL